MQKHSILFVQSWTSFILLPDMVSSPCCTTYWPKGTFIYPEWIKFFLHLPSYSWEVFLFIRSPSLQTIWMRQSKNFTNKSTHQIKASDFPNNNNMGQSSNWDKYSVFKKPRIKGNKGHRANQWTTTMTTNGKSMPMVRPKRGQGTFNVPKSGFASF